MPKRTFRPLAVRILFLGGSLLLSLGAGLLAGEVFLRLFSPQPLLTLPPAFQPAPDGEYYELRPDLDVRVTTLDGSYTIRTSPSGNRGKDPDGPPRPGRTRIVFCGDSFCFGNGVEEEQSIPHQVELLLDSSPGGAYEVFNIGQPGYSLPQSAARLEAWLDRWGADEAILLLFTGNDFEDGHPDDLASLWVDENGQVRGDAPSQDVKPWTLWSLKARAWLWRHSMLYSLFRRSIANLRNPSPGGRELYRVGYPTGSEVLTGVVRSSLARMEDACRRHGASFTVAVLPSHPQADEGWWDSQAQRFEGAPPGTYDRWAPQSWLESVCDSLGTGYVDLAPVILRFGRKAFLKTDRHLTPEASRAVAEELADDLRGPSAGERRSR